MAFFDLTAAEDALYRLLACPANQDALRAKLFTEEMWDSCREYIDSTAQERAAAVDFCSVWCELYFAYSLMKANICLVPNSQRPLTKGVPDLLVTNPRIWIEVVAPKPGDGPDALREPLPGEVFSIPEEAFILRLRTAVAEKIGKIHRYIENGTIQAGEAAIIAVSAARLPFRFQDYPIPNIVRALYGVGSMTVELDIASRKILGVGAEHRDKVAKKSQALVQTDLFLSYESSNVSAILYSCADCANFPSHPGSDFVLVHNPLANVPVPIDWLRVGDQFCRNGDTIRRESISD